MPPARTTLPNRKSEWETVEQEQAARQQAAGEQIQVFRSLLPTLLKRLARMPDPRNPKTLKHKLTVLMIYGLLTFVFQMASRREANRQMTRPMFQENLKLLFPELEVLPHQDTLNRLLCRIEVDQLETALIDLIRRFIRRKKFYRYLIGGLYPIAVDGTQKLKRRQAGAEEWLQRKVAGSEEEQTTQYYVSVLEANLAFANGLTLPLLSEFLSYRQGDSEENKQDSELKAFRRLAARLKEHFPRLPVLLLLDGLYPNGPLLELCRQYHWDFMIVLPDDSLPSVWEEVEGLSKLETPKSLDQTWGDRRQHFCWINGIEYYYGPNQRKKQILHVVICEESWEEVAADSARIVEKTSRHAWISDQPLSHHNVHQRCNLGARHRWAIENSFLVEKRHGYQYEHCFSHDWNAMRGYHYLMRLGHLVNILAQNTERLAKLVRLLGARGFIRFLRQTFSAPWLDAECLQHRLAFPYQLRLE